MIKTIILTSVVTGAVWLCLDILCFDNAWISLGKKCIQYSIVIWWCPPQLRGSSTQWILIIILPCPRLSVVCYLLQIFTFVVAVLFTQCIESQVIPSGLQTEQAEHIREHIPSVWHYLSTLIRAVHIIPHIPDIVHNNYLVRHNALRKH